MSSAQIGRYPKGKVILMTECGDISIKEAMDELLETRIFKAIEKRNNKDFAQKLAGWLIRYILMISSMNESLKMNLEMVLLKLHGDRFKKIVEITQKTFTTVDKDTDKQNRYIW
jgi:diketogulonate reductase-like aldo/keto reductase